MPALERIEWPYPWMGLITELAARHMPPSALQAVDNMYYSSVNVLRSRGGFDNTYSGTTAKDTKEIYYWDGDGKLYHADDNATFFQEGVSKGTVLGNVTDMASYNNGDGAVMIVAEELGARDHTLHTWDGADYAELTKKSAVIENPTFNGEGLHDMTTGGTYSGAEGLAYYRVRIDGTGAPDTFQWSNDAGETWEATAVSITGSAQTLESGVTVTFAATTGHTAADRWDWTVLAYPDVPHGEKVMTRWGRLFIMKNGTDNIYWSAPLDHTNFGGYYGDGGFTPVAAGEYGSMVDWIEKEGIVYILKERAIFELVGDDTEHFLLQLLTTVNGPVEGTIADCVNGIGYAAANGIFPLGRAAGEAMDWTRRIEGDIQSSLSSAKAAYSSELGAYVVIDGTNKAYVSCHHNHPDVWTKFTLPCNATAIVESGGNLWIGDDNGDVYKYDHDSETDDGSAFPVSFTTADWNLGDANMRKSVRLVEGRFAAADAATVAVKLRVDGSGSATRTETIAATARNVFKCSAECETLAVEFVYTSLTAACKFGGFAVRVHGSGEIFT